MSEAKIAVIDKGRLEVNRVFLPLLDSNGLATFRVLMAHSGHGGFVGFGNDIAGQMDDPCPLTLLLLYGDYR